MTAREAAAQYIARGWHVVPLRPQDKKCLEGHDTWLQRDYTPDDFSDTHNIGIKSVQGLVDIDCDCAEAVFMAEAFLPRTPAIYGRRSRPRSHWLYRCEIITDPLGFKDNIAKKMLIEVRVKHQSMAPPSTHPEGETVEWDANVPKEVLNGVELPPKEMAVDKPVLMRAVQLTATGAMMARYYNPPGARHDWGVALSGFLRRLGVTQAEADKLFEKAGRWAQDDKIKDRLDAVRSTYAVSDDTPTTGAKRLIELIGDHGTDFCQTLNKIWGGTEGISKTKLEELNKKHAVLFDQAGHLTIMTEEHENGMLQIRFTSRADFNLLYPQQVQVGITDKGKPITKPLGEHWVTHPKRRFYRGIELAPNGHSNDGYYNLWQGFAVEPKQGDWGLFRDHISLLVDGNEDHYQYVLSWMAETVQHPERPIGVALSFKGGRGTGKSTFATWFGGLFGPHFLHLDSEHRLLGQFNAHLHNTIVVFADEAVWAGGKQGLGALKRMITENTLAIERKGVDVINARNMLHMIIASNEDWFVPAGFDERRFAIFKVSDARQNQHRFFAAVHEQLKNGGLAGLLYDLLHHRSDINLRIIPETSELHEQKKHSMSPRHAWWLEQLHSGAPWQGAEILPPDGEGEIYYQVDPELLYGAYITAMRQGESRMSPGFMGAVGRFMRTVLPSPFPEVTQRGGKRFWILPSLEKSRKFFDERMRITSEWGVDAMENAPEIPF